MVSVLNFIIIVSFNKNYLFIHVSCPIRGINLCSLFQVGFPGLSIPRWRNHYTRSLVIPLHATFDVVGRVFPILETETWVVIFVTCFGVVFFVFLFFPPFSRKAAKQQCPFGLSLPIVVGAFFEGGFCYLVSKKLHIIISCILL